MELIGKRIYNKHRDTTGTIIAVDLDRTIPYAYFKNDDGDDRTAFSQLPIALLLSGKAQTVLADS